MQAIKVYIKKMIGLLLRYFYYFNTKIFLPKNSLIFKMACEEGIYDADIYRTIIKFLDNKNDSLLIDIGANIGLISVSTLSVYQNIDVISFEPSPSVFPFLEKTYNQSDFKERWTIYQTALGNESGETLFKTNNKLDSAFDGVSYSNERNSKYIKKIKITTLDKIIQFQPYQYSKIVIKIDVEGFELNILKGGLKFIKAYKPIIIVEILEEYLNRYNLALKDVIDLLNITSYRMYGLSTLNEITTLHELKLSLLKNLNFVLIPSEAHEV